MVSELDLSLDSVKVARQYEVSREALWQRIHDETAREVWWPKCSLNLRDGGAVAATVHRLDGTPCLQEGAVDVLIDGHAFGFSWRQPEDLDDTSVLFTLTSLLGRTQLSVLEVGFRTMPKYVERLSSASAYWTQCLDSLTESLTRETSSS